MEADHSTATTTPRWAQRSYGCSPPTSPWKSGGRNSRNLRAVDSNSTSSASKPCLMRHGVAVVVVGLFAGGYGKSRTPALRDAKDIGQRLAHAGEQEPELRGRRPVVGEHVGHVSEEVVGHSELHALNGVGHAGDMAGTVANEIAGFALRPRPGQQSCVSRHLVPPPRPPSACRAIRYRSRVRRPDAPPARVQNRRGTRSGRSQMSPGWGGGAVAAVQRGGRCGDACPELRSHSTRHIALCSDPLTA